MKKKEKKFKILIKRRKLKKRTKGNEQQMNNKSDQVNKSRSKYRKFLISVRMRIFSAGYSKYIFLGPKLKFKKNRKIFINCTECNFCNKKLLQSTTAILQIVGNLKIYHQT